MNKHETKRVVVVTGDVTIDWNIARVQRADSPANVWNADDLTCAFWQRGGASMLADLIEAVAMDLSQSKQVEIEVRQNDSPRGQVNPGDDQFHHSYATWAPFEMGEHDLKLKKVWRVREFLGLHRAHTDIGSSDEWKRVVDDPLDPDLIILDDAALGFRDNSVYWPQALLSDTSRPWILLKMARPVAEGKLWDHLQKNHVNKLVVVMNANDLRRHTEVHISRQISWERTAQDLVWELLYNPRVNVLTRCAHVVVSFDTAGAALLSRKANNTIDAVLFFDPNALEGEWGHQYKGYMIGYTSCLTAGIARELMVNTSEPNLPRGIQSGISAMRFLHTIGYGYASSDLKQTPVAFPVSNIVTKLVEDGRPLAAVPIKNPAEALSTKVTTTVPGESPHLWTLLKDQAPDSLEGVARKIVREGLEHALSGIPIGRFGKLASVDRREIEALNCISSLIREYCQRHQNKPFSIAVFGPPGSGKSFAVSQGANSVRPREIEVLTFNLSQLDRPEDLLDAFHQVRDKGLSGKIPLVFWDEFDTALDGQSLGWLRHFLAPMQDGEFQEGQIIHPIGRSIFVFAGGTSHSMEAFGANLDEEKLRAVKLPDFVSRLKGFLNILGPNPQKSGEPQGGDEDPYYIIRRAILLRSIFERNTPQLLRDDRGKRVVNIDEGLLRAFLLIKEYKHGVRSMEAVVITSQLAGKTSFARSSLPTETQLDLHVDGREFYTLMHLMELDKDLLEKLAETAHEVFCDRLRSKGYRYGPKTRDDKKVHSSLVRYAKLPEDEKEQNRSNVRDIPNKLASIGYAMIPARGNETPSEFQSGEIDKLAEMEHERWMEEKINAGGRYAKTTDKTKKLHQLLVPWHELPHEEQEKDYVLVRGIPKILAKTGYTMVKLS